jgi:hypothetical protein
MNETFIGEFSTKNLYGRSIGKVYLVFLIVVYDPMLLPYHLPSTLYVMR